MLPEWLLNPPASTFFTVALASAISLVTTILNRKFVDWKQITAWKREIDKWNAERRLAKKTGDKKLLAKVKKQEPRMLQMQSKMFSQQMKTSMVTFIPLIIIWQVLMGFFQSFPVARLPGIYVGEFIEIPFFYWYMICSFFTHTILSKVFGTGMAMTMGTETSKKR
ncbi:MAG: EMC3/TMCO1 family protein [Candidatus Bathyarchaeia archaeon]